MNLFGKKQSQSNQETDFPILYDAQGKRAVTYLDSACQSLRPRQVLEAMNAYYEKSQACSGRSMHRFGNEATKMVKEARGQIAKFINAKREEEIVFTRNTTEGINLVAASASLNPGDKVLISDKEHNSNLIPWQKAVQKRGIQIGIVPTLSDNQFDLESFKEMLQPSVKLVSLAAVSNLDGVAIPLKAVIDLAHANGSLVLVDGAQSVPHQKTDVQALDLDFLAFSGHKICGPTGTGALYGKFAFLQQLEPFLVGGDTVSNSTYESCEFLDPPEKFEAGLQDYAGVIGLGAAVAYLTEVGFERIASTSLAINEIITEGILEIPGSHLIGPQDPRLRHGIASFYIDGIDSHRVALMLDQMANVMVRSGMHCVHSWFNSRKLIGSVRASAYFYNTEEDAENFVRSLQKVQKVLR